MPGLQCQSGTKSTHMFKFKRNALLATVATIMSAQAMATTNIDVGFVITQATIDAYGMEQVANDLNRKIEVANTYYNQAIPDLDVKFRVRTMTVIDGASLESDGCTSGEKTSRLGSVLTHAGHFTPTQEYLDFEDPDANIICFTNGEQHDLAAIAEQTGADFWVAVGMADIGGAAALAKAPANVFMNFTKSQNYDYVIAHEFGHLLGLADLYLFDNGMSVRCPTGGDWDGRLMCGGWTREIGVDPTKTFGYVDATAAVGEHLNPSQYDEVALIKANLNTTTFNQDNAQVTLFTMKGTGAGLATEVDDGNRQVTLGLTPNYASTLSATNLATAFTVTLSEPSDKPVLVQVYSKADTAEVGNYEDSFAQTVTFEPGETSKSVELRASDLNFSGTRTLSVGVRNAAGAEAVDAPMVITLTGSQTTGGDTGNTGGNTSSGSSGGGSMGWLTLLGLGFAGLGRKFRAKK